MTRTVTSRNRNPIDYSAMGVLSAAHSLNDLYANYIPALLPFLVLSLGLNATKAAILVSAFSLASSFAQPVFGYFLDKQGIRWFVHVGTLWMAVWLSLCGYINNFPLLILICALAGLGTAAFHPQASTMISVIAKQKRGILLSLFIAFGNIGFALSLLILPPFFAHFGLKATLFTVIPGIAVAILLYFFAPKQEYLKGNSIPFSEVLSSLGSASRELIIIIVVIAIRALVYSGILTLFPLYFSTKTLIISWNNLMFIMLFCGALGGVLGGFLSDRFGRKKITVISLILTTPLFFAFINSTGIISTVMLAFAGASLLSSFSVTVVQAQEAIPNNKSLASGISMGLANGVGSLLVIPVGRIGDLYGLNNAFIVLFILPVIAGFVALFMKNDRTAKE
ncbi:MFS transporter [Dehalobacter sp. DCM]|uniref:MFS transporter n=1 Tax=Dehalobacter sp. DCM TaxID=2907827 RepID=UPI0030818548|nr:MFS transporter [Dehalobacter sp. DCM]